MMNVKSELAACSEAPSGFPDVTVPRQLQMICDNRAPSTSGSAANTTAFGARSYDVDALCKCLTVHKGSRLSLQRQGMKKRNAMTYKCTISPSELSTAAKRPRYAEKMSCPPPSKRFRRVTSFTKSQSSLRSVKRGCIKVLKSSASQPSQV